MVLAPEHPLVAQITSREQKAEVEQYQKEATKKSEIERQENKQKTGVFTGAYVINPANNQQIPVWLADYVLLGYV
jgi:leucyl-tRNA synthetase